jgi:hypothetical protein
VRSCYPARRGFPHLGLVLLTKSQGF